MRDAEIVCAESPLRWLICLLVIGAVCSLSQPARAAKTDVIHLKNGDRITGDIKEMRLGEMRVNTDAMGYVLVKWANIDRIASDKYIQFETTTGSLYSGWIADFAADRSIRVRTEQGEQSVDFYSIVQIKPVKIKQNLWDRMDKTLQLGFSYTRASDILRWNVQSGIDYRTLRFATSLSLESFVTHNREGTASRRAKLDGSYTRYVGDRYFWYGSTGVEQNDELGIEERYQVAAGAGRFLWQRPGSEFSASLGVSANVEQSTGSSSAAGTTKENLEGVAQLDWTFFKLNVPRSRIGTNLQYFPGISDSGRNRANFTLNLRQEFVLDLFWNVELYASYDSRPPAGAISKEDYGVITSLQYDW